MKLLALVLAVMVALAFVVRIREDGAIPPEDGVVDEQGTSHVILENVAIAGTADKIDQAARDLKTIGLWDDLTGRLYKARITARPRTYNIPDDGHLADARLTGVVDGEESGALCDITFYPAAMRRGLAFYERQHDKGVLDVVPTVRQFYAQVLGHELAHCLRNGQGEDVARAWEREVFDRMVDEELR